MSSHQYDFCRLPERIQRQLARGITDETYRLQDGGTHQYFYITRALGALFFAWMLVLLMSFEFGVPGKDALWDNKAIMVLYAFLLVVLAYIGVRVVQFRRLDRLFGFQPAQYLFGFTMVDARQRMLKVFDLTQLDDLKVTHQHINGVYVQTEFAFKFKDRSSRKWMVSGKKKAERFWQKLDALQAQSRGAFDRNDVAALLRLDPFFEIRRKGWVAPQGPEPEPMSPVQRVLAMPVAAAILIALVATPAVWSARNAVADVAVYKNAKRLATEAAYQGYLYDGKFYVAEIRAALPRVAFEEVRKKKSVTELRKVLQRYPKAGLNADVAKAIHVLYQNALAKFATQAATADPALLPSMTQLLQVLEQRGNPRVGIRFVRPTNEAMAEMDRRIKLNQGKANGMDIIPAASHFGSDSAAVREARIVSGLVAGFRQVFSNDVLSLEAAPGEDGALPALTINYQIEPSGALYTLEKTQRGFVGLVARFQSGLQIGPDAPAWRFEMEVEPPDHFRVEYQLPPGQEAKGPADSAVYAVMAERAFDALASKMSAAFFRPDSAAFQRMKGKPVTAQR
ncbi:hypothetical protein [Massilia sp. CF038]|uniref:hypothetical protein n=1 Tax=Massilia sp. CF038 TaxID=1881045 RepID=UPI000913C34D|nr:hypothetical protein [Massilia sp. CF038]SHG55580.1 hypothetical protein SAMN05428948_1009 [Massilia sp. CF038]